MLGGEGQPLVVAPFLTHGGWPVLRILQGRWQPITFQPHLDPNGHLLIQLDETGVMTEPQAENLSHPLPPLCCLRRKSLMSSIVPTVLLPVDEVYCTDSCAELRQTFAHGWV